MLAFADSNMVNVIDVISEGEHKGKLRITINTTLLSTRSIIADVKDVHSVLSLSNDDLGSDDTEGNVVIVHKHIDAATGEQVNDVIALTIPADAYRNKVYMEWILTSKEDEG